MNKTFAKQFLLVIHKIMILSQISKVYENPTKTCLLLPHMVCAKQTSSFSPRFPFFSSVFLSTQILLAHWPQEEKEAGNKGRKAQFVMSEPPLTIQESVSHYDTKTHQHATTITTLSLSVFWMNWRPHLIAKWHCWMSTTYNPDNGGILKGINYCCLCPNATFRGILHTWRRL